jgi:uncharacterized protein (TIGR04255 family)
MSCKVWCKVAKEDKVAQEKAQLNLPDFPRVQLDRPPLRLVVCQLQYEAAQDIQNPTLIAPIQQEIAARYPQLAIQPLSLSLQFNQKGIHQQAKSQWVFSDDDNVWTISLSDNSLSLQTRRYRHFEEFEERLGQIVGAVSSHLEPGQVTRFGLRFINEIRRSSTSLELEQIVRRELCGPLTDPAIEPAIVRVVSELQLQVDEWQTLTARYGRFLNGTTVALPDEPSTDDPFFLLDLDAFESGTERKPIPFDRADLVQRLWVYHKNIYKFFRWAVSEHYLQEMAGTP